MLLYVHVPFCARRCSYCDFAIAVRRQVPAHRFAELLLREWEMRQDLAWWDAAPGVETIYFGGGTPSLLDPGALGRILDGLAARRPIAGGAEITLEANPDDVTLERARAWRAMGITRVSLGAQSFHPATLQWMHRTHTASDIPAAVRAVRRSGLAALSLDLIYGVPEGLGRDWAEDLGRALALEPEHLSLYALTVEAGTALFKWTARGEVRSSPDDRVASEYLQAHATLRDRGFDHYEVSNAARPGHRARHNAGYWHREAFLGLGPSAHSGAGRERAWNLREWEAWARALEAGDDPRAGGETLDPEQVRLEETYLGLRTDRGVPEDRLPGPVRRTWVREGWAVEEARVLRLTAEGWLRLDALVRAI
jgi:oxygen-independent coproporphyrinogen-3 oxidase